ncbi:putative lipase ROG1 [Ipomoea triloba]|uniref:putative lipase ROG1 n=1 Tax=Ipomoea triloba TaxID=35885 RepID=UPI00125E6328|nr:putative lipase ROG1 [Ipomoea triloba]
MGSLEMKSESDLTVKEEVGDGKSEMGMDEKEKNSAGNTVKKWRFKKRYYLFPCMRLDDEVPTVERSAGDGGFQVEATEKHKKSTHLVVMVNGIIGSAENWKFPAKQFVKAYPQDVIVHCSESNSSTLTFDGVDVMGKRLAEEVTSVVQRYPNLQKISFIGHSLGGLISRYAIATLYGKGCAGRPSKENGDCELNESPSKENGDCELNESNNDLHSEDLLKGKIAGLEPVNFITIATPHLGSRGHKQVPAFCGLYSLENVISRAAGILGRTGRHLFLTDHDNGKPPLLLQMTSDSEDLPFISALESFRRRVAYANIHFDHIVGWSTSSIRPRNELPKRKNLKRVEKYPHIVNLEPVKTPTSQEQGSEKTTSRAHKARDMEEAMIKGLTKLSWERIDVSFRGSKQRYFAHNTIQVQKYCINSDGADVIQHMIDNFVL